MSSNKRVRFSNIDLVHELDIPDNSPLPELPDTPPTHKSLPGPSPYKLAGSTSRERGIRVHRLLRFTPSETTAINYDMRNPPHNVRYHFHSRDSYQLNEAATDPPLETLFISSPDLPTHIAVSSSKGRYVTVLDVLEETYRYLRNNISEKEYYSIPDEHDRQMAANAFRTRYSRFLDQRVSQEEKRKGMKKIDLLKGRSIFSGLSATKYGSSVWKLNCR
ncbi:hypothetical protein BDQ17DRAFT_1361375 [Cyathus striatus]|nr:hypothetical protein BDQ17DRAFT_1361375 [Cyathus striatus]